jgi:hypothetical protein
MRSLFPQTPQNLIWISEKKDGVDIEALIPVYREKWRQIVLSS